MSRNKRSGHSSFAAFTASRPLVHSATTCTSECSSKYSRMRARAGASSSTMTTVSGLGGGISGHPLRGFKWQTELRGKLAPLLPGLQLACQSKLRLKPLAHQRKTQAGALVARTIRIARIADAHHQHRVLSLRPNRDRTALEQV